LLAVRALLVYPGRTEEFAMRAIRSMLVLSVVWSISGAASAAPKTYVFTGKLTVNHGMLFNIPAIGDVSCRGIGLSNLTVMAGPGLTGMVPPLPVPNTPPTRTAGQPANVLGCAGHVPGKKITTTGAGVGGAFVMPTMVLNHPFSSGPAHSYVAAVGIHRTPFIQLATNFRITGPLATPTRGLGGSMVGITFPPAAFHAFKKGAWATQTGRQGSMFTWCFDMGAGCTKITQGTKPLIVKYAGGGNVFGGTMGFVIDAAPGVANIAVGAGGGAVGFARITPMGSQATGRGYASQTSYRPKYAKNPLWAFYKTMTDDRRGQKLITMVTGFLGNNFPAAYRYNAGFPWTTRTVLARRTGTSAGNPRVTTLTARGGDSVTAMGKRNLSLVAGGVARLLIGPTVAQLPEIGQLYLPEPRRSAQLGAGVLALLAVAAVRARRL
jgi:hypothetical protein